MGYYDRKQRRASEALRFLAVTGLSLAAGIVWVALKDAGVM